MSAIFTQENFFVLLFLASWVLMLNMLIQTWTNRLLWSLGILAAGMGTYYYSGDARSGQVVGVAVTSLGFLTSMWQRSRDSQRERFQGSINHSGKEYTKSSIQKWRSQFPIYIWAIGLILVFVVVYLQMLADSYNSIETVRSSLQDNLRIVVLYALPIWIAPVVIAFIWQRFYTKKERLLVWTPFALLLFTQIPESARLAIGAWLGFHSN